VVGAGVVAHPLTKAASATAPVSCSSDLLCMSVKLQVR